MATQAVPGPAVRRLSLYLRRLEHLSGEGVEKVSSQQLAQSLNITPAKVRKDLACFGQFGRPGIGYRVAPLAEHLRHILGTDRTWNVIVVGAGDLGRALLRYKGFRSRGFNLVAAFDIEAGKVDKQIGGVPVYDLGELSRVVDEKGVRLAIVTVPAAAAEEIVDLLNKSEVMGVLNFAPTTLQPPEDLAIGQVDLAAHLEQLSFQVAEKLRLP